VLEKERMFGFFALFLPFISEGTGEVTAGSLIPW
jgi:hypothetical protein